MNGDIMKDTVLTLNRLEVLILVTSVILLWYFTKRLSHASGWVDGFTRANKNNEMHLSRIKPMIIRTAYFDGWIDCVNGGQNKYASDLSDYDSVMALVPRERVGTGQVIHADHGTISDTNTSEDDFSNIESDHDN